MALPIVNLHRPDMISAVFERGVFRSLKSGARIEYSPENLSENNGFAGNFRGPLLMDRSVKLLMAAPYNLLPFTTLGRDDDADDPVSGVFGNSECPFSNLVLVNMQPKVVASNNIVDVELSYEHIMDGYNQILINPPSGKLFVKARSNIVEKATNFFRKDGNPANPRTQLEVGHTFPPTDVDILNMPFVPGLPHTVIQTGEITVPFPSKGFTLQGMIFTDDIISVARELVAHVNTETLFGDVPSQGAGHWLCSEFAWEIHNAFPTAWQNNRASYKVSMEFQYNFDTWDADAVFIDKRHGQPPAHPAPYDLKRGSISVAGEGILRFVNHPDLPATHPAGIWRVPFLPRRNFTQYFGNVRWEL